MEEVKISGAKLLPRNDTDLEYAENVAARLTRLEAFVRGLMDNEKQFVAWREEDEKGHTVEHSISELQAFEATFNGVEFIDVTVEDLRQTLKNEDIDVRTQERIAKDIALKQAEKVKAYKESEAIKAKELEALKAEGEKKRRAAYKIEHAEELKRIAIKAKEKEEYQKKMEAEGFIGQPIEEV